MKRPAFQFYPADWRKDPELRTCSIAARGLWIDMLCLMHEAEPYGHLVVNGAPVSDAVLARLVGEPLAVVRRAREELHRAGVYSVTDGGVVYSRRMVHDEAVRERRAQYGHLSSRNENVPRKKGRKDGRKDTINSAGKDTGKDTIPTSIRPSPSSSSSSSPSGTTTATACAEVATPPSAPPVLTVPCVGIEGGRYDVTVAQVAEWGPAYPGVDVLAELRRAAAWLEANPRKRKTPGGVPRFLVAWLSRAQNDAGGRSATNPAAPRPLGHSPEHDRAVALYDAYVRFGLTRPLPREDYDRIAAEMVQAGLYPTVEAAMAEWRITRPSLLGMQPNDDALRVRMIRDALTTSRLAALHSSEAA